MIVYRLVELIDINDSEFYEQHIGIYSRLLLAFNVVDVPNECIDDKGDYYELKDEKNNNTIYRIYPSTINITE